ncbi:hypothetical protein [Persicobacter sp. CCB-QB2]|uniref:hypothetical protein n=1 Tax=Persicobacter sp. CCB-QB2 TaxID=1561025 RepID=UPI0012FAAC16|nr:hypothetical protein [Persicobacter sp. CCB-QB2]
MSNCTHRMVRTGYEPTSTAYNQCNVEVRKWMTPTDSLQKIGQLKLGESGFAVSCNEQRALDILRNEACSINANIIN